MSYIISVDGNIGSGKSTLVNHLREKYKDSEMVCFLDEPVDDWKKIVDEDGVDILSKFYGDTKKYAFSFQMMAYISRIAILREKIRENPDKIIISERSVFTDRNVFAKMLYDDKMIEKVNYEIYLKWFDEFTRDLKINAIIYVNTNPNVCKERILKRNREGENIPIEYLEKCHRYHNEWIKELDGIEKIVLDGNGDKKNRNDYVEWFVEIGNHCKKYYDRTESL